MSELEKGDKVMWAYRHHYNSKSSSMITKKGVYVRPIVTKKSDGGMRSTTTHYAMVKFNGNKYASRVLISELVKI